MTTLRHDDGEESLLLGPDDATFEILTWCSDEHGQVPEQVHLIIEPAPQLRILYRFTGPVVLSRLINALVLHHGDVWPDYVEESTGGQRE